MTYRFLTSTQIAAPPALVFSTSLSVDFHRDSLAHTGEQAIAGVVTGEMGLGDTVTWRARHFGVWWKMTSEITELDEPYMFVDEQLSGPFNSFWHKHVFDPTDDGGTLMKDTISFRAPFGFIGSITEQVVLGRHLEQLIIIRNSALKTACETIHDVQNPS